MTGSEAVPTELLPWASCEDIGAVLDYERIYQLNSSGDGWNICFSGMPQFSDLEFDIGKPFWIKMDSADSWQDVWNSSTRRTYELETGWNLISYPLLTERDIDSVVLSDKITHIYAFENDTWLLWLRSVPINTLQSFQPGTAYWVYATEPISIDFQND